MERNYPIKRGAMSICAVLLWSSLFLAGCNTAPKKDTATVEANRILEEAKPHVDVALMEPCDTQVKTLVDGSDFVAVAESFATATKNLRACACKNLEMRNLLCKLTKPGCTAVPVCEVPK